MPPRALPAPVVHPDGVWSEPVSNLLMFGCGSLDIVECERLRKPQEFIRIHYPP